MFVARLIDDELILNLSDDVIDDVISPLYVVSFILIEGTCRTSVPGTERVALWPHFLRLAPEAPDAGDALRLAACAATRPLAAAMEARRLGSVVGGC